MNQEIEMSNIEVGREVFDSGIMMAASLSD